MRYNYNSGYGMMLAHAIQNSTPTGGKAMYVVQDTFANFDNLQEIFIQDPDGISRLFGTVQQAINQAGAVPGQCDVVKMFPGSYDEAVTIPRTVGPICLEGIGNKGDIAIAPSTAAAKALTFNNDGLTLKNIDFASPTDAAQTVTGTGSRCRAYDCKFEGADTSGSAFSWGPGSDAAVTAGTAGHGGDLQMARCEFAWTFDGLAFVASDYGAATQILIEDCWFHNNSDTCLIGKPGAFGIGSVRNLTVRNCSFGRMEDGTKPADFINVNTAFDTGSFSQNDFAIATNAAADIKIGAGIFWATNYTEAGPSSARPA